MPQAALALRAAFSVLKQHSRRAPTGTRPRVEGATRPSIEGETQDKAGGGVWGGSSVSSSSEKF